MYCITLEVKKVGTKVNKGIFVSSLATLPKHSSSLPDRVTTEQIAILETILFHEVPSVV